MLGKDIIKFIIDNKLEDHLIMCNFADNFPNIGEVKKQFITITDDKVILDSY